jgi:ribosomal-protein-alanine N-acetyltransferase
MFFESLFGYLFNKVIALTMEKLMIETKRLLIRKFLVTDAADLYEYLSLPEIYEFEPGGPITLEEAQGMSASRAAGDGFYAVVLKETQKMVGHLYFAQIEPKEFLTWELGYIFNPKYQNNGYASESARALIEYGFAYKGIHRVEAYCNPLNVASWRVMEKIGMRREALLIKHAFFHRNPDGSPIWIDSYGYGMLKEDL